MLHAHAGSDTDGATELDFLWLELTNRCNLQCTHCYSNSGPRTGASDRVSRGKYEEVIRDAHALGCRRIQFIGGEPTLSPDLPHLVEFAADHGFTFIEVFSNMTRLSDDLLACFRRHHVQLATSVYAADAATHDSVTTVAGSFERTVANIRRARAANVPMRTGVIEMVQNAGTTAATMTFLRSLDVENVGTDRLRRFGRGDDGETSRMTELCGGCAERVLCVGADGAVSPCIMSKAWSVGSVLDTPLRLLSRSQRLSDLRADIYRSVVAPSGAQPASLGISAICTPKTCGPYETCGPKVGPGPCAPTGCNPCYPKG